MADSRPASPDDTDTVVEAGADAGRVDTLVHASNIGRYVVLDRIGGGGMGVVFAAYDPKLDRRVALKILRRKRRDRSNESTDRKRMLREAMALGRLSHPNVVAVHDAGLYEDGVYVAMDFVEGDNLRKWIEKERPSWRAVVAAYIDAARGLAAAHEAGLVHRDFKPDNAVRDDRGRVRVLDFGLARSTGTTGRFRPVQSQAREEARRRLGAERPPSLTMSLTLSGVRMGTPAYMAPEQYRGEPTDARTDQFALCVALYEGVYGHRPFIGDGTPAAPEAMARGRFRPSPRGSKVPPWLRKVLLRGLSARPEDRWSSVEELIAALDRHPTRDRRRGLVLGLGVLVLGGATWGYLGGEAADPCPGADRQMAAVWNDARRQSIAARFEATDRTYAGRTADAVGQGLDTHVAAWSQVHADACEATAVRHEQSPERLDQRMACLRRNRLALGALVDRFELADASVVDHAAEAVHRLASPRACGNVDTLPPVPPPNADEITHELARAAAARATGLSDLAVALARPQIEHAQKAAAPTLVAEAQLLVGAGLEAAGEYDGALTHYEAAAIAAEDAGDIESLARARVALVGVTGVHLAQPESARVWAKMAASTVARLPEDPSLQLQLQVNLARLAAREGTPRAARAAYRRADEILEGIDEPDALTVAWLDGELAPMLAEQGELAEAERRAERSLTATTEALGSDHIRTAHAHVTVARVLDRAGEPSRAQPHHQAAIGLLEGILGSRAPILADLYRQAATSASHAGDPELGERHLRHALAMKEADLGRDHPDVASTLVELADVLYQRGRAPEAEAFARRALEIREAKLPPDHPDLTDVLVTLADLVAARGEHREAYPLYVRAVQIDRARHGERSPELIADLARLACAASRVGEDAEAERVAREALELAQIDQVAPVDAAWARLSWAWTLSAQQRPASVVRTLVDEALGHLDGPPGAAQRALVTELAQRHGWDDLGVDAMD